MLLRQFTLALATIASICSGDSLISFYPHANSLGHGWQTYIKQYRQCYQSPNPLYNELSNIKFWNSEWFKWHFTLAVYSNIDCSGDYKQWQLSVGTYRSWVAGSVGDTMNGRINSWKISDQELGNAEGHIDEGDFQVEYVYWFNVTS